MTNSHRSASTQRDSGIALVIALISVVLVAGIGLLMFTRSLNEIRHSADDARIVQTLMLARGGANVGAGLMTSDVVSDLYGIVFDTATPSRWSYGKDPASGVGSNRPDPVEVAKDLAGVARRVQESVDALVCGVDPLGGLEGSEVELTVFFTESACNDTIGLPRAVTLPSGRFVSGTPRVEGIEVGVQEYALPYVLVSEARLGDYQRNIVAQGEYIFSVGEAPFSHYAYFTNRESDDGGRIYFTDETMIDGPTHTNGHFAFYENPWFGGVVTTAGCKHNDDKDTYRTNCLTSPETRSAGGYFYSSTLTPPSSMGNPNSPEVNGHAPEFSEGVSWDAQYVPLPHNSNNQETVALGSNRDDRGIHISGALEALTLFAGDEHGNTPSLSGGRWVPPATYQYVTAERGSTFETHRETVRREFSRTCRRWTGFIFSRCADWSGWSLTSEEVVTSCSETSQWVAELLGEDSYVTCDTTTSTVEIPNRIEYRFDSDNVLEMYDEVLEDWIVQDKPFNGVIYVTGTVERLRGPARIDASDGTTAPPAVASFAQMTVAGRADIRITTDLRYEQPPCSNTPHRDGNEVGRKASCENMSYANVLGVFTSGGDVKIGNGTYNETLDAPDNVHVHAVLMSSSNQVRVENHTRGSNRGNLYLLGGMIQENRGIFGLLQSRSGFDRVYTYDPRMKEGLAPPFFPTTGLGTVREVRYFSFGQREQLY